MNEHELRRALAGYADEMHPTMDTDRLRAGMVRADRLRAVRTTGVAALLSTVVVLGIFAAQGRETATPLDVVDSPPSVPEPSVDFPVLDNATAESSTTTQAPTTTEAPPTTLAPLEEPSHLTETTTTTQAPAVVEITTTAPPTTAPPTTTVPPPSTTTTTPPAVSFFASALYGSCAEDPPFDEYSGTAAPGATITITSPWSAAATTTADGAGNWYRRVEFPTSPLGVNFMVTITDGTDTTLLDFIRTA